MWMRLPPIACTFVLSKTKINNTMRTTKRFLFPIKVLALFFQKVLRKKM